MIAAFLASAAILGIAAWFVISSARAYIAAEQRIDERLQTDAVLSRLSSTIDAAQRDDPRETLTKDVRGWLVQAAAERDKAHRKLEVVERAAALLGALAIGVYCFAYSALLRALRERKRLAQRLQTELNHDPITGLPNRGSIAFHRRMGFGLVPGDDVDADGIPFHRDHGGAGIDQVLFDRAL